MTIRYVLWDFGDTLVDQDWMLRPPETFPDWPQAWVEVARGDLEHAWNLGDVTCEDIAQRVSNLLGMPLPATMDHIQYCCSNIRFFDAVLNTARDCLLPQAIVTVNPDVFTKYVVPFYRLDELFPVIVTSWQEKTENKTALCARAVQRLGGRSEYGNVLLIDNIEKYIRDWEQAGGQGYVFRGETQFVADLKLNLRELTENDIA